MKVLKPEDQLDSEWLWQYDDGEKEINVFDAPDKLYMTFGVFYLDRLATDTELSLLLVTEELTKLVQEWQSRYPWSEFQGISMNIRTTEDNVPYTFGQICVEDNVHDEELLMTNLLYEFSSKMGPQVFIKISDTEGDFILSEIHDFIPEEYEYPIPNNRFWLHEGKFKMIPTYFYDGRGLKKGEALDFLRKAYFKLIELESLNVGIKSKILDNFPNGILDNLVKLPLKIESQEFYDILTENPQLISFLIKNLIHPVEENEDVDFQLEKEDEQDNCRQLELLVPRNHCDLLSLYLDTQNLKTDIDKIPLHSSRALFHVFQYLVEKKTLEVVESERTRESEEKLTQESVLNFFNFEQASLEAKFQANTDVEPTEELMDKLTAFFGESDKIDITNEDVFKKNNEEALNEEGIDSQAKNYFQEQNVDIDEDDFFEYFLKGALKLKGEKIEEFRRHPSIITTEHPEKDEIDIDVENEFEEMFPDMQSKENVPDSLNELFKSLSVDGAPTGPFQSLLRNLKNETK
ncbi:hypothetical protein NCAS_0C01660 [Naumovozyma castellii]|uniref:Uncharacterized protein n=1 Tax=Naumovozyma castellii TaxID=27288 RepID=G0VCE7_NAUCA|nr:hypothetical protein NCAS_0C01660 [Naumovozyma castellii CBS 4309]CCC69156.1 hypothetical protein NCAS_0C01660 [Naumovozyma castellii CBS 4309]